SGLGAETTPENRQQRHQHGNAEQHQQEDFAADHEDPVAQLGTGNLPDLLLRQRQRDVRAHQANTCRLRGGKATMICCAPRRGMASGASSASNAWPGSWSSSKLMRQRLPRKVISRTLAGNRFSSCTSGLTLIASGRQNKRPEAVLALPSARRMFIPPTWAWLSLLRWNGNQLPWPTNSATNGVAGRL